MTPKKMKWIAQQVLDGRHFHEIDFGDSHLSLQEKLTLVDLALKHYPSPETPLGQCENC